VKALTVKEVGEKGNRTFVKRQREKSVDAGPKTFLETNSGEEDLGQKGIGLTAAGEQLKTSNQETFPHQKGMGGIPSSEQRGSGLSREGEKKKKGMLGKKTQTLRLITMTVRRTVGKKKGWGGEY